MFDKCRKLVTPFEGMAAHSVQFEKEAVIELDVAEEKINNLQQLKAEICAFIAAVNKSKSMDETDTIVSKYCTKWRKYTAV